MEQHPDGANEQQEDDANAQEDAANAQHAQLPSWLWLQQKQHSDDDSDLGWFDFDALDAMQERVNNAEQQAPQEAAAPMPSGTPRAGNAAANIHGPHVLKRRWFRDCYPDYN